ncbi:MAG: hypothetical protein HY054_09115 [Proteobacteria bacterium]|nr:hypothetical protein [Pseudomonadota bacterium]
MAGVEKETRPASAGLRLLTLTGAVAICAPATANAAAWIAPIDGQQIFTSTYGNREGLRYSETSGYLEAPVTKNDSVVIAPWLIQDYIDDNGWRAEATAGVKHVITHTDHTVAAVQVSALWVSSPPAHCDEGGAELRVLGGVNLPHNTFVNAELAERVLSGGCSDQRAEFTGGMHLGRHWMGLAQVFVDGPQYGDETVKAQLSLVHFDNHHRGIQIGIRDRIDGGEDELAVVVGFWTEPRRARDRRRHRAD